MGDIDYPMLPAHEISAHPIVQTILKTFEATVDQMDDPNLNADLVPGRFCDEALVQTAHVCIHGVYEPESKTPDGVVGRDNLDRIE